MKSGNFSRPWCFIISTAYYTLFIVVVFFCVSAGCGLPGSLFVPRLARRVTTQPRGGGSRRTGPDHRFRYATLAAAGWPALTVRTTSRVCDHAAPGPGNQAHLVPTGPDARLQGAPAQNDGAVDGSRACSLGRGSGDHLQPGAGQRRARPTSSRRVRGRQGCGVSRLTTVGPRGHSSTHTVIPYGCRSFARPPRRRHNHQEPRPWPDSRYPVTVGCQVGASGRISPPHGE